MAHGMTYEECLGRMVPYQVRAEAGSEFDRELYLALRAATSHAFAASEDEVDGDVKRTANR